MSRFLAGMTLLAAMAGAAVAESTENAKAQMDAMVAEMNKCMVCKNYGARMPEIGALSTQVVALDNGMALVCDVQDASKVAVFHAAHDAAAKAGAACTQLTDAEAKSKLCGMCQGVRSAALGGATVSSGKTRTGDMLVIVSADANTQQQIAALKTQCEAMMGR